MLASLFHSGNVLRIEPDACTFQSHKNSQDYFAGRLEPGGKGVNPPRLIVYDRNDYCG